MPTSREQFAKSLVASGLLTADEVAAFWKSLPPGSRPSSGDAFAKSLVSGGKLTEFQAVELLEGQSTPLVLGPYVIVGCIGAGGMGRVYKAQHKKMKRVVALKVLSPETTKNEASRKRFQREVESAARLSHPNIVQAHDAGEEQGVNYLVMEFVDGPDLSTVLKQRGPLPAEEVAGYLLQAARGLAYAHGEGLVHRDIKPANLLLDKRGTVKILDLGLARFELEAGVGEELTNSGQVMGTVDYMAPEQALDTKHADARADIYSLGCTLYRLVTGRLMYDGDTLVKKLLAHREAPIPPLGERASGLPELEAVFQCMVAKRPEDRFQSMAELIVALEALRKHEPAIGNRGPAGGEVVGPPQSESPLTNFLAGLGGQTTTTGKSVAAAVHTAWTRPTSGLEETIDTVQPAEDTNERIASLLGPPPVASYSARSKGPSLHSPPVKSHSSTNLLGSRSPLALYGSIGAGALTFAAIVVLLIWALGGRQNLAVVKPKPPVAKAAPKVAKDKKTPSAGTGVTSEAPSGASLVLAPLPQQPAGWVGRSAFPGDWVSLMPTLNTRGAAAYVRKSKNSLIVDVTDAPAAIPAEVSIAAQDYDLLIDVEAVTGIAGFNVLLPHAGGQVRVNLGYAGKCSLEGDEKREVPLALKKGERRRILLLVKQSAPQQVTVHVDGQEIYAWKGNLASVNATHWPDPQQRPALNVNVGAAVELIDFKLLLHDGAASLLPAVPLAPATELQIREAQRQARPLRLTSSIGISLNYIPFGKYTMGSPAAEPGRDPAVEAQREINIQRSFYMGTHEVTREQYQQVVGSLPAAIKPDRGPPGRPVVHVSQADAENFCRLLSELPAEKAAGRTYHLPTSEWWEYACRAGTQSEYYHGGDPDLLQDYAWIQGSSPNWPLPGGQKLPNHWGLCDMLGNVWEWCAPLPEGSGGHRGVHRGGSAGNTVHQVRCATLQIGPGTANSGALGFRVVCELPAGSSAAANSAGSGFALAFDGKSQHVRIPTLERHALDPLTIEAWAVPAQQLPNVENALLIMFGKEDTRLQITRDPSRFWQGTYYVQDKGGGIEPVVVRSAEAPSSQRQHVAYVMDRVDDKIASRLYVDGKLAGELPPGPATVPKNSSGEWSFLGGTTGRHFAGVIDEVRISSIARYAAAFDPPARFTSDDQTLALYHLDEGSGDTIADASGHGHEGRIYGATWVPGISNQPPKAAATPDWPALKFTGASSRVELPAVPGETGPFTLELWFHAVAITNTRDIVRTCVPDAGEGLSLLLFSKDTPMFSIFQGQKPTVATGPPISMNEWHHLAAVYGASEIRLYQDGRGVAREPVLAPLKLPPQPLWLGNCGSPEVAFHGRLRELRLTRGELYTEDFQPLDRLDASQETLALYHLDEGQGEAVQDASAHKQQGQVSGATWVSAQTGQPLEPASP